MYGNLDAPGVGDYLKRLLSNRERAIQLRVRLQRITCRISLSRARVILRSVTNSQHAHTPSLSSLPFFSSSAVA